MTDRRPIIAGNWKMHLTHLEAIQTVQKLSYLLDHGDTDRVEVVMCPPFTALRTVETNNPSLSFGAPGASNTLESREFSDIRREMLRRPVRQISPGGLNLPVT